MSRYLIHTILCRLDEERRNPGPALKLPKLPKLTKPVRSVMRNVIEDQIFRAQYGFMWGVDMTVSHRTAFMFHEPYPTWSAELVHSKVRIGVNPEPTDAEWKKMLAKARRKKR
jgi:hypothetical protein